MAVAGYLLQQVSTRFCINTCGEHLDITLCHANTAYQITETVTEHNEFTLHAVSLIVITVTYFSVYKHWQTRHMHFGCKIFHVQ